jgi:hypothetical protein
VLAMADIVPDKDDWAIRDFPKAGVENRRNGDVSEQSGKDNSMNRGNGVLVGLEGESSNVKRRKRGGKGRRR